MGLSMFGYIVLAIIVGAVGCAFAAGIWAFRKRSLSPEDFGTLVLVPLSFFLVGSLREELHTGWALFLWPIIISVLCMYAFSAKVAFVDAATQTAHRNSRILFLAALAAVAAAALLVPPWYE